MVNIKLVLIIIIIIMLWVVSSSHSTRCKIVISHISLFPNTRYWSTKLILIYSELNNNYLKWQKARHTQLSLHFSSPAPCTPANMSSVVDCEANSLVVSWSESPGANSYIATVQDRSGQPTTCQAMTEGRCNVTGLGCGQIYQVSVVSSDGYCNSPPTPVVDTAAGRKEEGDRCVQMMKVQTDF